MTLNGHFALKSGPSSTSNGLAFWLSAKTIRKFAELYAYNSAQQKFSPASVMVIIFMGLFISVTRRGIVKPVDCIHTHSSHACCSLMPVENKYYSRITILELGSRQNMTGIQIKRARGKCISNALVCQLCWTFFLRAEMVSSIVASRQD